MSKKVDASTSAILEGVRGGLEHYGAITEHDDGHRTYDREALKIALTIGLYQEIRKLNQLLDCHNFRQVPRVLREIRRNTTKKKRATKSKK